MFSWLRPSERRRHVRLPVHEALLSRGDLPAPSPQLLPPSSQQLLRPLGPVPPPGGLVTRAESLWHLQRGFAPDERQLPGSPQMPRIWSGLVFTLLSHPSRAHLQMPEGSVKGHQGSQGRSLLSSTRYNLDILLWVWCFSGRNDVQLWLCPEDIGTRSSWAACGFSIGSEILFGGIGCCSRTCF